MCCCDEKSRVGSRWGKPLLREVQPVIARRFDCGEERRPSGVEASAKATATISKRNEFMFHTPRPRRGDGVESIVARNLNTLHRAP